MVDVENRMMSPEDAMKRIDAVQKDSLGLDAWKAAAVAWSRSLTPGAWSDRSLLLEEPYLPGLTPDKVQELAAFVRSHNEPLTPVSHYIYRVRHYHTSRGLAVHIDLVRARAVDDRPGGSDDHKTSIATACAASQAESQAASQADTSARADSMSVAVPILSTTTTTAANAASARAHDTTAMVDVSASAARPVRVVGWFPTEWTRTDDPSSTADAPAGARGPPAADAARSIGCVLA